MSIPQVGNASVYQRVRPCCQQRFSRSELESAILMRTMEKVSLIVLCALSSYASVQIFVPFFATGIVFGVYKYSEARNNFSQTPLAPSCTQGVLEQITGVRLPAPVALAANVAITACHTVYHAMIFVPIVALSAGIYLGKNLVHHHRLANGPLV